MFHKVNQVVPGDGDNEYSELDLPIKANSAQKSGTNDGAVEYSYSQEIEIEAVGSVDNSAVQTQIELEPVDDVLRRLSLNRRTSKLDAELLLSTGTGTGIQNETAASPTRRATKIRDDGDSLVFSAVSPTRRKSKVLEDTPSESLSPPVSPMMRRKSKVVDDMTPGALEEVGRRASLTRRASNFLEDAPTHEPVVPTERLMNFDAFKTAGTLLRFPSCGHLTTALTDIDRSKSLVVFISHRWLRANSLAPGWDGQPHPDNTNGDVFKLCVEGIYALKQSVAPQLAYCYIWMDYCCIDQDKDTSATRLIDLKTVMEGVDCVFTPIIDHSAGSRSTIEDWQLGYDTPSWKDEVDGYINRGWCRLEMFYASNIPIVENLVKADKFQGGLRHLASQHVRPHVVYGPTEMQHKACPVFLPPLQNLLFKLYDPRKGAVTNQDDVSKIDALVNTLLPMMTFPSQGWSGAVDEHGKPTGYGVLIFESGSQFEGMMDKGKCHGKGKMKLAAGSVYEGDFVEGNRTGQGVFRSANGVEYRGEFLNNKKHGQGIYKYASGAMYEGTWLNDRMNGKGKFYFADGSTYEGDFDNDEIMGHGLYTYVNGNVHQGQWLRGKRNGAGVCVYASGAKYEGNFENDVKSGHGKYVAANGDTYEGEFKDDDRVGKGQGTLTSPDGSVYTGEFKDGKMSGRGVYRWVNGNVYDGEWLHGNMTGQGSYSWAESHVQYTGTFLNGVRDGQGTFRYADGSSYEGSFRNDQMHGHGTYMYANGCQYEGSWMNGLRSGKGEYRDTDGNVYTGEFMNGKCHGPGTLKYANNDVFEGSWVDDKKDGAGRMRYVDGRVVEGEWKADKMILKTKG